jgi:hypothetical protein
MHYRLSVHMLSTVLTHTQMAPTARVRVFPGAPRGGHSTRSAERPGPMDPLRFAVMRSRPERPSGRNGGKSGVIPSSVLDNQATSRRRLQPTTHECCNFDKGVAGERLRFTVVPLRPHEHTAARPAIVMRIMMIGVAGAPTRVISEQGYRPSGLISSLHAYRLIHYSRPRVRGEGALHKNRSLVMFCMS